jgi:quercetin dioxygenase-like cupin family protein
MSDATADRSTLRDLAGSAFATADLVAYQPGAIVSRTIVDDETVTVTAFAFDEGERLSEHTAPHDAILQVLDGTARVTVDGEVHEVEDGQSLVLPADDPHAVDAPSRFTMLLTMIR